jgi:pimeloyl-ACP methyl ester carboxylesterase
MVSAMLSERYDSAAAAPNITVPALLVHGERDDIVPVELGRRLFDALPGPKRWLEVRGAGHNDLLARPEPWEAIAAFLRERRTAEPGAAKRTGPSDPPGGGPPEAQSL